MFIVSGGKGTGKTRALIERAKAENGVIVCADPVAMRARAHEYGIVGLEIVSYSDIEEFKAFYSNKQLYIHDINNFIRHSFSEVRGYSLNLD